MTRFSLKPAQAARLLLLLLLWLPNLGESYCQDSFGMELRVESAVLPQIKPHGTLWDISDGTRVHLPDAYAVVEIDGRVVLTTRIVENSLAPLWNTTVRFESGYLDEHIRIRVFDSDVDWSGMALEYRGVQLEDNLERIRQRLLGDDEICSIEMQLNDSHAMDRNEYSVELRNGEGRYVGSLDFEVRPSLR